MYEIRQCDLDEINTFINRRLLKTMSDSNISFGAMAFILRALIDAVDVEQQRLDKERELLYNRDIEKQ